MLAYLNLCYTTQHKIISILTSPCSNTQDLRLDTLRRQFEASMANLLKAHPKNFNLNRLTSGAWNASLAMVNLALLLDPDPPESIT